MAIIAYLHCYPFALGVVNWNWALIHQVLWAGGQGAQEAGFQFLRFVTTRALTALVDCSAFAFFERFASFKDWVIKSELNLSAFVRFHFLQRWYHSVGISHVRLPDDIETLFDVAELGLL